MRFNIDDNFDHDLNFLVRNGLVEKDGGGSANRPPTYRLTEMGRMQAEKMAARHTMVNLRTGIVSSPGLGGGLPESEGGRNNRCTWAGNLVFDPRSIRCPANLRQRVPSRRFYRPREGKDRTWVDDSTTPEEEYQRRYYLVEIPEVVDVVGEEWKLKKARRADRKSPSTVVDRVVEHELHHDGDNDEEDSDVTINMSENGNVNIDIE
jgi:hypothetical protein